MSIAPKPQVRVHDVDADPWNVRDYSVPEVDAHIATLEDRIAKLERWKAEALVAMRENEEWRNKLNHIAVDMGYAGRHYLQSAYEIATRCQAAELRCATLESEARALARE